MRRREFVAGFGATATWPLVARAQHTGRMRRIGVLMNAASDDPESVARLAAFVEGLRDMGWADGANLHIVMRWAGANTDMLRRQTAELVGLAPDVILAGAGGTVATLLQAT